MISGAVNLTVAKVVKVETPKSTTDNSSSSNNSNNNSSNDSTTDENNGNPNEDIEDKNPPTDETKLPDEIISGT